MKSFFFVMFLAPLALSATWTVDKDHSVASFKVRHMMVSNTTGAFSFTEGTVNIDDKDFTKSKFAAVLDTKSINTNNTKRDEHLKSADFLDAGQFPIMKFASKAIASDGDVYKVTGDFTMHGVTKEVVLTTSKPAETIKDQAGGLHTGMSFAGKLNRKNFGISWNKTLDGGGLALGEEVTISVELELLQKPLKIDKKS